MSAWALSTEEQTSVLEAEVAQNTAFFDNILVRCLDLMGAVMDENGAE